MGTSISQPSQRSTNWTPVHVGYKHKDVPTSRIINEIWRASEKETIPISNLLKEKAIFDCYNVVKNSVSLHDALNNYTATVIQNKSNSIITEFAKKSIPAAFQSKNPKDQWVSCFFSEVTKYIVSRDLSGFIGDKYRSQTIKEIIALKNEITKKVFDSVQVQQTNLNNHKDWSSFVDSSINKLKTLE